MDYIKISEKQHVRLEPKKDIPVAAALAEAIVVCGKYKIEADLEYNGFTFGIDADSDWTQLIREYRHWLREQNKN
jgi:hypothetical protein